MLIKNILSPDKSTTMMKLYHKSNKAILPFMGLSFMLDNTTFYKKYFDFINISNLTLHSYISISCVITDYYKKIPFTSEKILKLANFKIHTIGSLYFLYILYNKYYRPEIYNYENLTRRKSII